MKKMDPLAAIGATGVMDLKKLAEWFHDSRLDPNDPSNADIVYILRVCYLYFHCQSHVHDFGLMVPCGCSLVTDV